MDLILVRQSSVLHEQLTYVRTYLLICVYVVSVYVCGDTHMKDFSERDKVRGNVHIWKMVVLQIINVVRSFHP